MQNSLSTAVDKMQIVEQLKKETYKAVEDIEANHIAVAFSGGLDSSFLAKVCKDMNKKVTLLTVAFGSRRRDIRISTRTSKVLELPLLHRTIPPDELESSLKRVLSLIEFHRIARLENCVCFYHVFKLASNYNIHTVLSANGADELFCGYHVYTRQYTEDEEPMKNLMNKLVKTAKKDKEQIHRVAQLFNIRYECPFLSQNFIDFAGEVPFHLKIKDKEDKVRKHILRDVALKVGVPQSAALRPKKAFQYSSGLDKAIRKLAKEEGFTKTKAKKAGHQGKMEAYLQHLKNITNQGSPAP